MNHVDEEVDVVLPISFVLLIVEHLEGLIEFILALLNKHLDLACILHGLLRHELLEVLLILQHFIHGGWHQRLNFEIVHHRWVGK